jgi:hypothetical protein
LLPGIQAERHQHAQWVRLHNTNADSNMNIAQVRSSNPRLKRRVCIPLLKPSTDSHVQMTVVQPIPHLRSTDGGTPATIRLQTIYGHLQQRLTLGPQGPPWLKAAEAQWDILVGTLEYEV